MRILLKLRFTPYYAGIHIGNPLVRETCCDFKHDQFSIALKLRFPTVYRPASFIKVNSFTLLQTLIVVSLL